MLKDITIGQFFPGNSIIHRLDSRFKIVLDIAYVVMLFMAGNYCSLISAGLFMLIIYMMSGISFKLIFKSLKPIMPIILFTCILNLFFIHGEGDPLVKLGFITIYAEGINTSVFMTVRIVFLIVGMSLLTYTTSPIALTDAIERLLSPLKKAAMKPRSTAECVRRQKIWVSVRSFLNARRLTFRADRNAV